MWSVICWNPPRINVSGTRSGIIKVSASCTLCRYRHKFLDLDGISGSLLDHCHAARTAVRRETKIPTCIGFAETKTKAKLANFLAKKRPEYGGVCDLRSGSDCTSLYPTIPIEEVWGIGAASAKKLNALGINTVAELIDIDLRQARDVLTVTGARVVMELRGRSCLPLTLLAPQRKGLAVTRTFGTVVTEWAMAVLDGVNGRFGRGALRPAVTGFDRKWTAKAEFLSPRYTTRLDDLMRVYT
jgi:nucleotidyltransferase/DNA polymerase involved in DNA repair